MDNIFVVGICGYARTGKDSFASIFKQKCEKKGFDCHIFNLANDLKEIANLITLEYLNIDSRFIPDENKEMLRPLLVGIGETFRNFNENYWLSRVNDKISRIEANKKTFVVIPDVRYLNEAKWINSFDDKDIIYLYRDKIIPPNSQELKNIPEIKSKFDLTPINWPEINLSKKLLTNDKLNCIVEEYLENICI